MYILHNAQDRVQIYSDITIQLIEQLSSARLLTVKRSRINAGKLILSLIYLCDCQNYIV